MQEDKEPGEIEESARLKDQIDHQKMELVALQKAAELKKRELHPNQE